jgi:glucose-1-phosphate thymidylyltransferase
MAITAVLLAAGYATRLYPLTEHLPKALLPLGSGVILDELMHALAGAPEVTRRILVTNGRFAAQFLEWQRSRRADVDVVDDGTLDPGTRLGAIRDLELARARAGAGDDLLVLGTDNLFRWPLAEFIRQARRVAPAPSVALWEAPSREAATQFGVVVRDRASRITAFAEKSARPPSAEVALCVYFFPAAMCGRIRAFLDERGNPDAPGYFIEWLVRHGEVYGIMMPGAWYDIGTREAYEQIVKEWHPSGAIGGSRA